MSWVHRACPALGLALKPNTVIWSLLPFLVLCLIQTPLLKHSGNVWASAQTTFLVVLGPAFQY